MDLKKVFCTVLFVSAAMCAEQISEPDTECSGFCFKNSGSFDNSVKPCEIHRNLLLKSNSNIKTKKIKVKGVKTLKKRLFSIKQNNIKMYIYNNELDANETFDISDLNDKEITKCIRNTFKDPIHQEVSWKGTKVIKISDILGILFKEKLGDDDYFLKDPIIIDGQKAYFSTKAIDKALPSVPSSCPQNTSISH